MIHGKVVTNMQRLHPIIAFGIILFYLVGALVFFTFALVVRLFPQKVKIPVGNGSLEKIRPWLR